ncbi:MAG: DUF5106 domain-containing protein [Planctomycetaceae bacterium]|jgi:hypothetical protein|nr:DUF5106 domain-containing protein [Planctomycetaceae bacterium]
MNQYRYRQFAYFVSLAVLLVLLYLVGRPAKLTVDAGGEARTDSGGLLAQTRAAEGFTESQIGKIDPASSTIKLATFGMRGVAVVLLWNKVQEHQKRHDWNTVIALTNQLVFLEPHFTTIWEFLGWNLAYNASAEFDDYRERYRWVIRGIDFLATGVERNQLAPKLCKACGWTVSQKIGGAGSDENEQYRRLLKEDEDFGLRHDCPLPSDRDNWLLGRRWYHQGEELVLQRGVSLMNESDFTFFANSRSNLFSYAKWKRKDGIFGEEAIRAWENAAKEWMEFAKMDLATAIPEGKGLRVNKNNYKSVKRTQLEAADLAKEEIAKVKRELDGIVLNLKETLLVARWNEIAQTPGQRGTLLAGLEDAVNWDETDARPRTELLMLRDYLEKNQPDWRTVLQKDRDTLYTPEELELQKIPQMFLEEEEKKVLNKANESVSQIAGRVNGLITLSPKVIAEEIQDREDVPREKKSRAREILSEIDQQENSTRLSKMFRDIVGYDLKLRDTAVETTMQADDAHRLRYFARKAYYDGRINDSITGWLDAMRKWDEVVALPQCASMLNQSDFLRDTIDVVKKFVIILDKSNKIFSDVVEADPVPMRKIMWNRTFRMSPVASYDAGLEFAKKEFDRAATETDKAKREAALTKVERYFTILTGAYAGLNRDEDDYMKYAPFFDLRDRMIESQAYFVKTLVLENKPMPEPASPLRDYVELMLEHDKNLAKAKEPLADAAAALQEKKFAEARTELDKVLPLWKSLLDKYPLIQYDANSPVQNETVQFALLYAAALKGQNKPLPEDFPFKAFVK